ncbi:hypothetical protein BV22DRAFT_1025518, partial [Leucogyrophana mollusca]
PGTPTAARRTLDADIDPTLYTPSKRMRLMTAALAKTASGSFLVSKTPVTSTSRIPRPVLEGPPNILNPDWNLVQSATPALSMPWFELECYGTQLQSSLGHAQRHMQGRDAIIEGAHAQLIIQDIFCMKQSQALHTRENKKENDQTKLFPGGKGQLLTSEEFMEEVEGIELKKQAKEVAKTSRRDDLEAKRKEKESIEARWKEILQWHDEAVEKWEADCGRWYEEGLSKAYWDKRPSKPTKPKQSQPVATTSAVTIEDLQDKNKDTSSADEDDVQ